MYCLCINIFSYVDAVKYNIRNLITNAEHDFHLSKSFTTLAIFYSSPESCENLSIGQQLKTFRRSVRTRRMYGSDAVRGAREWMKRWSTAKWSFHLEGEQSLRRNATMYARLRIGGRSLYKGLRWLIHACNGITDPARIFMRTDNRDYVTKE